MMSNVDLALFKFKCLEGVLENWYAHEPTSSVYRCGNKEILVDFDLKNSKALILDCNSNTLSKEVPISELINELTKMGLVKERTTNRHENSYIKYGGPF